MTYMILSMRCVCKDRAQTLESFGVDAETPEEALATWRLTHSNDEYRFLKLENAEMIRYFKADGWDTATI